MPLLWPWLDLEDRCINDSLALDLKIAVSYCVKPPLKIINPLNATVAHMHQISMLTENSGIERVNIRRALLTPAWRLDCKRQEDRGDVHSCGHDHDDCLDLEGRCTHKLLALCLRIAASLCDYIKLQMRLVVRSMHRTRASLQLVVSETCSFWHKLYVWSFAVRLLSFLCLGWSKRPMMLLPQKETFFPGLLATFFSAKYWNLNVGVCVF